MFKPLFGRRQSQGDVKDRWEPEEEFALADMEVGEAPEGGRSRFREPTFQYEEVHLHPAGIFTAALVDCRLTERDRVVWTFQTLPENEAQPGPWPHLGYVTGTMYHPENKLCRLMGALGVVDGAECCSGAHHPDRRAVREAVTNLDPDDVIGKQCRIRVEHVRDDLGNITPQITDVGAPGAL